MSKLSNNYQDCLKMLGNMLVYLIIQNSRFYYIVDMRKTMVSKSNTLGKCICSGLQLWGKSLEILRSVSSHKVVL